MFAFVTGMIFLIIALLAGFLWKPIKRDRSGDLTGEFIGKRVVVWVAGSIAALILVLSSFTYTQANQVGIVTNMGANPRALNSGGIHMTYPWSSTDKFTTRLQLFDCDDAALKFNDLSQASVDIDVGWKIKDDQDAVNLWKIEKNFKKIEGKLVKPACKSAVNKVMNTYAPEDGVAGGNQNDVESKIKTELNSRLEHKYGIQVDSVVLGAFTLSKQVQERLNKIASVKADAQILAREAENIAQANTNANNRKQALTPVEFARRCYELTQLMIENKYGMGTSWTCQGIPVPVTANK